LGAVAEAAAYWRQAADLAASDDPDGAARDRTRAAEAVEASAALRDATVASSAAAPSAAGPASI